MLSTEALAAPARPPSHLLCGDDLAVGGPEVCLPVALGLLRLREALERDVAVQEGVAPARAEVGCCLQPDLLRRAKEGAASEASNKRGGGHDVRAMLATNEVSHNGVRSASSLRSSQFLTLEVKSGSVTDSDDTGLCVVCTSCFFSSMITLKNIELRRPSLVCRLPVAAPLKMKKPPSSSGQSDSVHSPAAQRTFRKSELR